MDNQNSQKVFNMFDQMSLWFSLGVGLLVMQMGSFLAGGIDVKSAILAILLGSIIGSLILASVGYLGQRNSQNSAQLITTTFGTKFAKLPILLNIIQLLGWCAFEFVIMSEGLIAIIKKSTNLMVDETALRMVFAVFFSGLVIYLLSKPMTGLVRKLISKIALPLVVVSLLWLSIQFIGHLGPLGLEGFINQKGNGDLSFAGALDLVIAMPISWLPLICDYSRFGKDKKGTISGTFLGYVIANIWCYALGLLIAASPNQSENFVATILLAQGGLIALGLILFDELDNAYGDAYSGAVSIHGFNAKFSENMGGKILVAFAGACAAFLPMHDLEKFLLILSSVFIPLFAVILGYNFGTPNQSQKMIRPMNGIIWSLGIVLFQFISRTHPEIGASLPTFVFGFVVAFAASRIKH